MGGAHGGEFLLLARDEAGGAGGGIGAGGQAGEDGVDREGVERLHGFGFVAEYGMTMRESAPSHILSTHAYVHAVYQEASVGHKFCGRPVDPLLLLIHAHLVLQEFLHLTEGFEILRIIHHHHLHPLNYHFHLRLL